MDNFNNNFILESGRKVLVEITIWIKDNFGAESLVVLLLKYLNNKEIKISLFWRKRWNFPYFFQVLFQMLSRLWSEVTRSETSFNAWRVLAIGEYLGSIFHLFAFYFAPAPSSAPRSPGIETIIICANCCQLGDKISYNTTQ